MYVESWARSFTNPAFTAFTYFMCLILLLLQAESEIEELILGPFLPFLLTCIICKIMNQRLSVVGTLDFVHFEMDVY